jgi:hypothetical protein
LLSAFPDDRSYKVIRAEATSQPIRTAQGTYNEILVRSLQAVEKTASESFDEAQDERENLISLMISRSC